MSQAVVRQVKRPRSYGPDWAGEYGYGRGQAHPSVETSACTHCGRQPGKLCLGQDGVPRYGTHVVRRLAHLRAKRGEP